jgi:hypothetical protein
VRDHRWGKEWPIRTALRNIKVPEGLELLDQQHTCLFNLQVISQNVVKEFLFSDQGILARSRDATDNVKSGT